MRTRPCLGKAKTLQELNDLLSQVEIDHGGDCKVIFKENMLDEAYQLIVIEKDDKDIGFIKNYVIDN